MASKITQTPLMKQYEEMKRKFPDAILLFRVGDFYETFYEDAIVCSEILGITLTRRANGINNHVELAGFPHHALDTYLPKLVRAGKRVAICEQIESPLIQKKMRSKTAVSEVITPGKTESKPEAPITKAVEAVKAAASQMPDWNNTNEKYRQLTFDFDI